MVDLDERWRKLLEEGKVRWLAGMQGVGSRGCLGRVYHESMQRVGEPPRLNGMEYIWGAGGVSLGEIRSRIVPNWCDPATLGCLLALVREAWGDPALSVTAGHTKDRRVEWEVEHPHPDSLPEALWTYFDTEAEALVAALEAAP